MKPRYVVKAPPANTFPSDLIAIELIVLSNPVPISNVVSFEPSELSLINLFCVVPVNVVNAPPANTFPSDWIAIELTVPSPLPILNVESFEPSVLSLINESCVEPVNVEKEPPTNIFPSDWIDIEITWLLNPLPISNDVSFEPSELSLIKLFCVEPEYVVKFPPTNIFPSDWIAIDLIVKKGWPVNPVPISNDVSFEPSELSLIKLFCVEPVNVENTPPANIFPSDWIAIESTMELNPVPILNDVSLEPSELSLINLFCVEPVNVIKTPPTNIFPSDWIAVERTALLNPLPISNDVSFEPSELSLIR